MESQKSILLICYTFPPSPGIGGRRWAKFAKYLAKDGYTVHVICAEHTLPGTSEWSADVKSGKIRIYPLPRRYPRVFSKTSLTLIEKIQYRFWLWFLKIYSAGSLYDRSIFWGKQLNRQAGELIRKHDIKNLVVTIPPFALAHHCIELKNKFSAINFIVDYRDPWTDNKSFHGFKDLKHSRFNHELSQENEVLNCADKVITVSPEMTGKLIARKKFPAQKFITIQNGFDPEDLIANAPRENDNMFRFVYTGSLYSNLEYVIKPLLEKLSALKTTHPALYTRLSFEFYGNQDQDLLTLVKAANLECIHISGQIPLHQVFAKINASDYCLLFSAPDHSFAFNTKFFEYLAYRKPILLFSHKGQTSEFIISNQLGRVIEPENFEKSFDSFISDLEKQNIPFNPGFDIQPYSLVNNTARLKEILV